MSRDPFDELLKDSDPVSNLGSGTGSDAAEDFAADFAETRSYWDQLSTRRSKRHRRVRVAATLASLAAVVFLAVGAAMLNFRNAAPKIAAARSSKLPSNRKLPAKAPSSAIEKQGREPNIARSRDDSASHDGGRTREQSPPVLEAQSPRHPDLDSPDPFGRFVSAVKVAGKPGSRQWQHAVSQLARATPRTQRVAIDCVAKIAVYDLRTTAFQLVCDAAGESEMDLLSKWLSEPNLRTLAFDRLAAISSTQQRVQLATQARTIQEQRMLCRHLASSPDPASVDVMLKWSHDASWRLAIRSSLNQLHPAHVQRLVLSLRQRDRSVRTAAAFLLASVPGDSVDRVAASMIREKRYLQPAYIALLARRSPSAQFLLASVMQQRDLSAALYSAQLNFQSFTEPLQQWLSESQGQKHDTSKHQSNEFPIVFDLGFLRDSAVG